METKSALHLASHRHEPTNYLLFILLQSFFFCFILNSVVFYVCTVRVFVCVPVHIYPNPMHNTTKQL